MSAQVSNTQATQHSALVEELKSRAISVAKTSGEALSSFAWLWPVRGLLYAVNHPHLILSVRGTLLKSLGSSAFLFLILAFFTYVPQAAFLTLFTGPLGPILALFLLGAESIFLLSFLAKPLFLEPTLQQVFDQTLIDHGQRQLVQQGKTKFSVTSESRNTLLRPLQALSRDGIVRYLLTLPLNAIPVLGTVSFLVINGHRAGPSWHARYFQLKGFDSATRKNFIEKHSPEYTAFGVAALLFNFIPVVGLVFTFTNTVGAALWAANMEARSNIIDPNEETTKDK